MKDVNAYIVQLGKSHEDLGMLRNKLQLLPQTDIVQDVIGLLNCGLVTLYNERDEKRKFVERSAELKKLREGNNENNL